DLEPEAAQGPIEGRVGKIERRAVHGPELHVFDVPLVGELRGQSDHLLREVNPDDATVRSDLVGYGHGGLARSCPEVEDPLTRTRAKERYQVGADPLEMAHERRVVPRALVPCRTGVFSVVLLGVLPRHLTTPRWTEPNPRNLFESKIGR